MAAGFQWDEDKGELNWPDSFSSSPVGLEQQKENFKAFLVSPTQLSSENLAFLSKVEEFRKNPSTELRDQIIKQFVPDNQSTFLFSKDDTTPVNLNSEHTKTIMQAKNSEKINSNLFDEAAKHIVDMMNNDTLGKFSGSDFIDKSAPAPAEPKATPESKGFSFGNLLSRVGELLLSGLKEVGKFLFSSPSSESTKNSSGGTSATDFLFDPGKWRDNVEAEKSKSAGNGSKESNDRLVQDAVNEGGAKSITPGLNNQRRAAAEAKQSSSQSSAPEPDKASTPRPGGPK